MTDFDKYKLVKPNDPILKEKCEPFDLLVNLVCLIESLPFKIMKRRM